MVNQPSTAARLSEQLESEQRAYQSVSRFAVLAALLGIGSSVAFLDRLLWLVPVMGALLSWVALRKIANAEGALIGRKLALVGLALSILFGAAAPTRWIIYQRSMFHSADQTAKKWFDALAHNEPARAHQLRLRAHRRLGDDDAESLWAFYRNDKMSRGQLRAYVALPSVRALLELGEDAEVRYVRCNRLDVTRYNELASLTYAVTYDSSGEKRTFFVRLNFERQRLIDDGVEPWRLVEVTSGGRLF
jgi:hypothetical protein